MAYEIFGIKIDDLSEADLSALFLSWLVGQEPAFKLIVTLNPEFLLQARKDRAFKDVLNSADAALPDGVGMRFALAALTPNLLTHRHTGTETLLLLANLCAEKGKRLGLVGGLPGSAEKAAAFLKETIPNLRVFGFDPGAVDADDPSSPPLPRGGLQKMPPPAKEGLRGGIIARLQQEQPDVLAVGLGQKKQELFLRQVAPMVPSIKIGIGIGGVLDVLGKTLLPAPAWMRRSGLEWLWRFTQEPKRFHRIWNAVVVFPALVIWHTLKARTFLGACRRTIPEIFRQLFLFS